MDFESGVYATRRFSAQAPEKPLAAICDLKWLPAGKSNAQNFFRAIP
jgi:hypothetical protein